jgi:menaquinone-dependent protoporphyrinogen oxidase
MRVLVLYATTEGQTRKIAEFVSQKIMAQGDDVALLDASDLRAKPDLAAYDGAILAASVHAHQYQASITEFARDYHERLNGMPALFVSVSLSAAGTDPKDLEGIAACANAFKAETGWTNAEVQHVAGAFRFTKYDFFKSWVMRLIAMQKKVKVKAGEDFEFTDWDALARIVDGFRARLAAPPTRKAG